MKKKGVFISIALIIIFGFIVYGNSLNGKFIWDDDKLIKESAYLKNLSFIPNFFIKDIGAGAGIKSGSYRPLQMITYLIDYSLWKLNVLGYHLTNILLHILVALGIYWFVDTLFADKLLAFFTSALFVVHPIHTEAVSYLSGRADPLASLFMLLTFILYLKQLHSQKMKLYILMLFSYIFALLSRENTLILPLLLLLYHYIFEQKVKGKEFFSILIVTLIYIVMRLTLLKALISQLSYSTNLSQRLPGFFVAITNYIRLLLLPFGLHMEYGNPLFYLRDPKAVMGIAIFVLSLIYAARKRNRNRLISFSIFWFFITLLPASNLYPINAYMAEHWLYLPSIGFFLILSKGLSWLYQRKGFRTFSLVLVICLLTIYSYLTVRQNGYWKDPIVFYERTLKYAPESTNMLNNLGILYFDMGRKEQGIALFNKAIKIDPADAYAYINLGYAYQQIGKNKEAIILFEKALGLNPDNVTAYNHLGNAYSSINMHKEAIASYNKAIEIDPNFILAYYNLGILYSSINMHEEAITSYKKAIEIDPNFILARDKLNNLYSQNTGMGPRN